MADISSFCLSQVEVEQMQTLPNFLQFSCMKKNPITPILKSFQINTFNTWQVVLMKEYYSSSDRAVGVH